MVEINFFPLAFFNMAALLALLWLFNRHRSWRFKFTLLAFWLYLMLVVRVMYFPLLVPHDWPASLSWQGMLNYLRYSANFIPFHFGSPLAPASMHILNWPFPLFDVLINILLTIPFGIGLKALTRINGWRALLAALATGLALEGTQLLLSLTLGGYPHVTDVNDVIMNALGVLIGYALYTVWVWALARATGRAR